MNAQKKRVGTKAQIQAEKEKERRVATTIFLAFILSMVILSAYFAYTLLSPASDQSFIEPTLQFKPENPSPQLKAAIVDQLSLTAPNPSFVETAATILTETNYTVDYFSGEKVTVNFFLNLPTGGYEIVILRVHSAPLKEDGDEKEMVNLFTSEPYTTSKHISEQLNDELVIATYYEGSPQYFGITPNFIRNSMEGTFNDAIIIMMGCDGLKYNSTAQAFIDKGAKSYASWSGPVSVDHTDTTTIHLLWHLLTEKHTIRQAVIEALTEVGGPDPTYKSILKFYPFEGTPYW